MEGIEDSPAPRVEGTTESREEASFRVEKIRNLLKLIDGRERSSLAIAERTTNIKGELMSMTFSSGEKTVEGEEMDITYGLTVAGQRYNANGMPSRVVDETFLTKDYDGGMSGSEQIAVHRNGSWEMLAEIKPPREESITGAIIEERAALVRKLGYQIVKNDEERFSLKKGDSRIEILNYPIPGEDGPDNEAAIVLSITVVLESHEPLLDNKEREEEAEKIKDELISVMTSTFNVKFLEQGQSATGQKILTGTESAPSLEDNQSNPEEWTEKVEELEALLTSFEQTHNLEALNAVQASTVQEVLSSEIREAAKKDLPELVTLRNLVVFNQQIPQAIRTAVDARYKAIQAAVGAFNNGQIDHSIRW